MKNPGFGRAAAWALARLSKPLTPRLRYEGFAQTSLAAESLAPDRTPLRTRGAALAMRYLLFESVRLELPIELRLRTCGLERVAALNDEYGGLILCVIHMPLDPSVRALLTELDWGPIVGITRLKGAALGTFGSRRTLEAIRPSRHAFVHARRRLEEGAIVLASQDVSRGGPSDHPLPNGFFLRANLFSFARAVRRPIACVATRLAYDGAIELSFGGIYDPRPNAGDVDDGVRSAAGFYETCAERARDRVARGEPRFVRGSYD